MKSNIVNLSDGFSERVAFVAAHTAVIYDKRLQKQIFMQVQTHAPSPRHGAHRTILPLTIAGALQLHLVHAGDR